MKYRNRQGKYISQKEHEQNEIRWAKTVCFVIIGAISLGIVSEYRKSHEVHVVETAEAATEETYVSWDPCDLHVILCEHERQEEIDEAVNAVSTALGREVTETTKERIAYLYDRTQENDVPFKDAVKTVYCESMWFAIKSAIPGEESYGLAQVHLPSHKHITKEQAMDAYFSIDFLVENWNDTKWYGYDRNTKTCTNGLKIEL